MRNVFEQWYEANWVWNMVDIKKGGMLIVKVKIEKCKSKV